jgi:translocation and assembly module TamB
MITFIKYLLLLFLLLLLGAIYYLGFTEAGLQWEAALLSDITSQQLQIKQVKGKLLSNFVLQDITYLTNTQKIDIKKIYVSWDSGSLLSGKVFIRQLKIDTATIKLQSSSDQSDQSFDIKLLSRISIQALELKNIQVYYDDIQVNADVALAKNWNATWQVNIPELKKVLPEAKGGLEAQGTLTGPKLEPVIKATFQSKKISYKNYSADMANIKAHINLTPNSDTQFFVLAKKIKIDENSIKNFTMKLTGHTWQEKDKRFFVYDMDVLKKYFAHANVRFPRFTSFVDLEQPVVANMVITTTHLDLLSSFISTIKNPQASVKVNLNVKGSLLAPIVSGDASLHQGRVFIPDLNIYLRDISLRAIMQPNYKVAFDGSLYSGKGRGAIKGTVDLNQEDFPVTLTLIGRDLLVLQLKEYQITASPDLKLSWKNNALDIQGKIFIPSANITPKNFKNIVTLPTDVVYVRQKKTENINVPLNLAMKVALNLGDDIKISYNELSTHLKGFLEIRQALKGLPQGYGELYTVKGTYKAFDKVFDIREGRIIFTGGLLTNPRLDVRAMRNIKVINLNSGTSNFTSSNGLQSVYTGRESLGVGVEVRGTVNSPVVTLISDPAGMSKNDILSYLLFGYPQAQISQKQTGTLVSLLSTLNSNNQSSKLADIPNKLKDNFNLTELNIKSTDVYDPTSNNVKSNTSVVVGKKLGEKLSVLVSKSLFDSTTILNLRYKLSKYFFVQSESSAVDNGGDLVYEIEMD